MPIPLSAAGDLPKRPGPGGLGLPNGRRDAIGECVSPGRVVRVGYRAGLGELGIAEGLSAGLGGPRERSRSARGSVEMQNERLDVRAQLRGDEQDTMRYQAEDEMNVPAEAIVKTATAHFP